MHEDNSLARSDLAPLEKVQLESIFIKTFLINSCGKPNTISKSCFNSFLLSLLISKIALCKCKEKRLFVRDRNP